MITTRLRRFLGRFAELAAALAEGNSPRLCWQLRRADLFRLPILYGDLGRDARVVVLDVGAAAGRSGRAALAAFPRARVVSVEPNPEAFGALRALTADHQGWNAVNVALGREEGEQTLTVFGDNPEASSLYRATDAMAAAWPAYRFADAREVPVPVRRLDGLLAELDIDAVDVLKLDVQGAELDVLEGMGDAIRRVRYLIVELAFQPVYEGGSTFAEVHAFLAAHGFALVTTTREHRDPTRRLVQADALYRRKPSGD